MRTCWYLHLMFLVKVINTNDCGLYRDDELLILRTVNGQKVDWISKNIIKTFKDIGFAIDVERNLKIVAFLDITFNLNNGTYRHYKKPNDLLSYINKSSNHPPQIINRLPKTINERLSRNSSSGKVFNSSKQQYEKPLRDSWYTDFELKFSKTSTNQAKRHRQRNIIWFNPEQSPHMLGKRFLQLLRHTTSHRPKSVTKYLIRTQWRWATAAAKMQPVSSNRIIRSWSIHLWKTFCHVIAGRGMSVP